MTSTHRGLNKTVDICRQQTQMDLADANLYINAIFQVFFQIPIEQ